jgi:hypothetical protein
VQRKALEESKDEDKSLEADLMDSLLGFSRLFKVLVELQKPIVGHNLLLDLMIMYNQFHKQLPSKFCVFIYCSIRHYKTLPYRHINTVIFMYFSSVKCLQGEDSQTVSSNL